VDSELVGSNIAAIMTAGITGDRNYQVIQTFRANNGNVGRPLLLLTTTGARTGKHRISPLAYTLDGNRYIVLASKAGADTHPDWYRNLVAHPDVTVEVGDRTLQARASVAEGEERERLFAAHTSAMPQFADYQERTSRQIPVVILEPEA
jgi:deazaflavin-dependent oxidoreductase (nitroreductase family)